MRIGALALAAIVLLSIACKSAEAEPFTQQRVDVGGYELNVICRGEGPGPTVIIEAGRGNAAGDWERVEPDVAEYARVCSYDRAGVGSSDPRPGAATGEDVARELHAALEGLDIEPPYVIAAHSIGVLYSRLFAEMYRDEVVGMILVDGSHDEQFGSGREDASTFGDEGSSRIDLTEAVGQLQNARHLGDMPLVAIHGGLATDAAWLGYHYKQARLSDNSALVIANFSGHFIYDDQPGVVSKAIRLVVDAARSGGALADCDEALSGEEATCVPLG